MRRDEMRWCLREERKSKGADVVVLRMQNGNLWSSTPATASQASSSMSRACNGAGIRASLAVGLVSLSSLYPTHKYYLSKISPLPVSLLLLLLLLLLLRVWLTFLRSL